MPFRIILAILYALLAVPARAGDPLSTRQMKALSAREANRVVHRDLLSILRPISRIDSGMFLRLRGVGLATASYGTEFANVCRRDLVSLLYSPLSDRGPPAASPLRPHGIETSAVFRMVHRPEPEAPIRDAAKATWQDVCRNLPEDDNCWFKAADAFHALHGSLVLARALDAVRAGTLQPEPCGTNAKDTTCRQAILAAAGEEIDEINECPAAKGQICYAIDLGSSRTLTITALGDGALGGGETNTGIAPGRILSVAVEEYIIVT